METAEDPCEEERFVTSDMHLSEGMVIRARANVSFIGKLRQFITRDGGRSAERPFVQIVNPLEDFPHDEAYAAFVAAALAKYGDASKVAFVLMGDCFDPLAVTWRGQSADPPFEAVGVHKMRKIIRAHALFFDTLADIVRRPNATLEIFTGNHDLFLVWPKVQREIVRRVAGGDPALAAKIEFVDHRCGFQKLHRGVLYDHGMNAEPQNTIDPKNVIRKVKFGRNRHRQVLVVPPGSHMTVNVVNRIKLRNRLVGRLSKPSDVWKQAAVRMWGWVFQTAFALLRFVTFWVIPGKVGLAVTLRAVRSTIVDESVDRYAEKLLHGTPDIHAVVLGHSHEWRQVSRPEGTYVNTGTWARMYELVYPKFAQTWKRFRRVETAWRTLVHFFQTGELPFTKRFASVVGFAGIVAALTALLLVTPAKHDWRVWLYPLVQFKVPIGIMLAFVVCGGLLRVVSLHPTVADARKLTFAHIRHFRDGGTHVAVKEFIPEENAIRNCI